MTRITEKDEIETKRRKCEDIEKRVNDFNRETRRSDLPKLTIGKGPRGQEDKGTRRMPWHREPKKDVTSCDKLRGGAHIQRSADFRMGEPTRGNARVSLSEHIAQEKGTQGTETSKYLQEEKETSIFLVAASERERGQTDSLLSGLRTTERQREG